MRWMLGLLLLSILGWPDRQAHAGERARTLQPRADSTIASGITQVLHRSQQARLDSLPPADRGTPATVVVQLSLQRLVRELSLREPVELRVVSGDTVAETVHGNVIVANEALAALPEGERMFILAHELGHVVLGHWSQMGDLYQRYIPGTVTRARTDAVSDALGRAASGMARRHEFDADAFEETRGGVANAGSYFEFDLGVVSYWSGRYDSYPNYQASGLCFFGFITKSLHCCFVIQRQRYQPSPVYCLLSCAFAWR